MSPAHYDVLIIGAGIHGAGVAQAAAAAGYSVLVLEKNGIAEGTSARSSKLIHGGLRYLETGQLSLVRECLRERSLLFHNAPQLVRPVPFYIPIYRHTRRRPWQIRLGLSLYALLTGLRSHARFQRVARTQWPSLDGLQTDGLQAVFQYWDGQTDDAALTRSVIASAQQLGASVQLHTEVNAVALDNEGCRITCTSGSEVREIRATVLINAAGPWVNQVLACVTPAAPTLAVDLVQGTHIVIDSPLTQGIYYTEAPTDGRAVFIMPWKGKILVGTTERRFSGNPDQVRPSEAEVQYLLQCYLRYFPAAQAPRISESFAGLRVLPKADGNPFHRSRDTVLYPAHAGRVLTIYGGKLTAYRATATKVLQRIKPLLPQRTARARTDEITLSNA